jgi:hypothetical protein
VAAVKTGMVLREFGCGCGKNGDSFAGFGCGYGKNGDGFAGVWLWLW